MAFDPEHQPISSALGEVYDSFFFFPCSIENGVREF